MKQFLAVLAFLCPFLGACQTITIKGTVASDQGEPIAGATIVLKRTGATTLSSSTGTFTLYNTLLYDTLHISAVGYQPLDVPNNERGQIVVNLSPNPTALQEVQVNTGYQVLNRERATGSFSKVNGALLQQQVSPDILSRLAGITPSLLFDRRPSSGEPLQIRGLSTLRSENASPLIVLDNFPYEGSLSSINPSDIESVTVLKDAAAASIWGARAGNGVIILTTKKAVLGGPRVHLSSTISFLPRPDLFSTGQLPSADFIEVEKELFSKGYYEADINSPYHPALSPAVEILKREQSGLLTSQQASEELNALRFRDVRRELESNLYQTGRNTQTALSLSGGTTTARYLLSVGYDGNRQTLLGNKYQRFTLRSDNTFTFFKKLRLSTGIALASANTTNNSPGGLGDYTLGLRQLYPYAALIGTGGKALPLAKDYASSYTDTAGGGGLLPWHYSPLEELQTADHRLSARYWMLNAGLSYPLTSWLTADMQYRWQGGQTEDRNHHSLQSYFARDLINRYTDLSGASPRYGVPKGGILDETGEELRSWFFRSGLSLQKSLSSVHQLSALLGAEVQESRREGQSNRSYGYKEDNATLGLVNLVDPLPIYGDLSFPQPVPSRLSRSSKLLRSVSAYGNAAYSYKGRYTLSASARKDASNLFGVNANERWTPLWSAGLLWNISNEAFYPQSRFPELKFRLTYGFSGNRAPDLSGYTTIAYSDAGASRVNLPFARIAGAPNPELRWEKVGMLNLGLDFTTIDRRIRGSLEYYRKNTRDLLGTETLDPTTGLSSFTTNSASLQGQGVDLELVTKNVNRALSWESALLFSYTAARVTRFLRTVRDEAGSYIGSGDVLFPIEGMRPYSVVSFPWAGLEGTTGDPLGYLNGAASSDYPALYSAGLASLIVHGPAVPPVFGSFRNTLTYKNFSLSGNITYRLGYWFRRPSLDYSSLVAYNRSHIDYLDRWQKPGDEALTQVPSFSYPVDDYRTGFYTNSSVTVHRGDHVRLEYLYLAFLLDRQKWSKLPFGSGQLFVAARDLNVVIWKKNKTGLDPDFPFRLKPSPSFSFGFQTTF